MLGGLGPSQGIRDFECDLMDYCIEKKGAWWANHFFRNKEVNDLYAELRAKDRNEISEIIEREVLKNDVKAQGKEETK